MWIKVIGEIEGAIPLSNALTTSGIDSITGIWPLSPTEHLAANSLSGGQFVAFLTGSIATSRLACLLTIDTEDSLRELLSPLVWFMLVLSMDKVDRSLQCVHLAGDHGHWKQLFAKVAIVLPEWLLVNLVVLLRVIRSCCTAVVVILK